MTVTDTIALGGKLHFSMLRGIKKTRLKRFWSSVKGCFYSNTESNGFTVPSSQTPRESSQSPAAASNQDQTTESKLNGEEMWGLLWHYTKSSL